MNLFGILKNTCKNCGENHLIYKKEYGCATCNKVLCDSCSYKVGYLFAINGRTCYPCYQKISIDIRKMIVVERNVISGYEILKEHDSIIHSANYAAPARAIEHLKYLSLQNGYDAITFLKTEMQYEQRRNIVDLAKHRNKISYPGYIASGIPVKIKNQS